MALLAELKELAFLHDGSSTVDRAEGTCRFLDVVTFLAFLPFLALLSFLALLALLNLL